MAQVKKQIKTPEKIQLRDEEIANPCTIQNTGNQDTTELVDYGSKIQKEVKAMQSEIKKNIQGTNSKGKETRTQINNLEQKEDINIQPEQNEETRIQKNEERLRNLHDTFKHSNI